MVCQACNYVMSDFDAQCPRCQGKGLSPQLAVSNSNRTQPLPTLAVTAQGDRSSALQPVIPTSPLPPRPRVQSSAKPFLAALYYIVGLLVFSVILGLITDAVRNDLPNRERIHDLLGIGFFLSLLCLVIGIISPKPFSSRLLRINTSRKHIAYVFGTSALLCAVLVSATVSDEEKARFEQERIAEEQTRAVQERADANRRTVETLAKDAAKEAECRGGRRLKNSIFGGGAVLEVKMFIERNAHDRRSIQFEEWGRLEKIPDLPRYRVRCKYRGKNRLGAYVLNNQVFYLDCDGNVLSYDDV
jgi:hypothetical protein